MKGVNFSQVQPNVTAKFYSDDVTVTKMYAQIDSPKMPTSNVEQLCVTLYNRNLTQLTYPNGTIIPMLKSRIDYYTHNPTIEGWFEGVKMIHIQICNTTDGKSSPKAFRFAVVGCYASRATFILGDNTKPTIPIVPILGTTTVSCKRKENQFY
jgi:hypothetical protein